MQAAQVSPVPAHTGYCFCCQVQATERLRRWKHTGWPTWKRAMAHELRWILLAALLQVQDGVLVGRRVSARVRVPPPGQLPTPELGAHVEPGPEVVHPACMPGSAGVIRPGLHARVHAGCRLGAVLEGCVHKFAVQCIHGGMLSDLQ